MQHDSDIFLHITRANQMLCAAAKVGYADDAQRALDAGADPNHLEAGHSPLMYAANGDFQDCARLLIARGADVNQATASGTTPLVIAVSRLSEACVRLLLESGANSNPDVPGQDGRPRRIGLLAMALDRQAAVATPTGDERLHAVMEALVSAGADPDAPGMKTSLPPLYRATTVRAVLCLLAAGASVAARPDLRLPAPDAWHRQRGDTAIADAIQAIVAAHHAEAALACAPGSTKPRHRA